MRLKYCMPGMHFALLGPQRIGCWIEDVPLRLAGPTRFEGSQETGEEARWERHYCVSSRLTPTACSKRWAQRESNSAVRCGRREDIAFSICEARSISNRNLLTCGSKGCWTAGVWLYWSNALRGGVRNSKEMKRSNGIGDERQESVGVFHYRSGIRRGRTYGASVGAGRCGGYARGCASKRCAAHDSRLRGDRGRGRRRVRSSVANRRPRLSVGVSGGPPGPAGESTVTARSLVG